MRIVLLLAILSTFIPANGTPVTSACVQGAGWGAQNLEIAGSCPGASDLDDDDGEPSAMADAGPTLVRCADDIRGWCTEDGSPADVPLAPTHCLAGDETCGTDATPPPITIADLASFTPAVGELIVQPENWGVLGIPTNFVATATDHVQQGTLLGQPIEVRWRPVAFTFDYGDGTVVTTTDAGAMWQSSDDDWTTTSTSHEYQERGQYTATVTITFEADIATGTGWATVPGQLDLAAPAEGVQVFEVQTVLTRGDCIDYPNDPGCSP